MAIFTAAIGAGIGAGIANAIINPTDSINKNTAQCCDKISNELSNTREVISKLVTACTNEVDVVKRLQILTIYGAYKLPNGDIEYKENDTRIVYNISTDEFKIYNNDSLTKSISKDGTVLLHKNEWTYNEKTHKLWKNGVAVYKIAYGEPTYMIGHVSIQDDMIFICDPRYDEIIHGNFRIISKLSEEKRKKWDKKKPFWWFNKKKYFEELKKFRSELNLTRILYNKLQKYNEHKAEVDRMLEYFNKIDK